jgi:hypothetical protein
MIAPFGLVYDLLVTEFDQETPQWNVPSGDQNVCKVVRDPVGNADVPIISNNPALGGNW